MLKLDYSFMALRQTVTKKHRKTGPRERKSWLYVQSNCRWSESLCRWAGRCWVTGSSQFIYLTTFQLGLRNWTSFRVLLILRAPNSWILLRLNEWGDFRCCTLVPVILPHSSRSRQRECCGVSPLQSSEACRVFKVTQNVLIVVTASILHTSLNLFNLFCNPGKLHLVELS